MKPKTFSRIGAALLATTLVGLALWQLQVSLPTSAPGTVRHELSDTAKRASSYSFPPTSKPLEIDLPTTPRLRLAGYEAGDLLRYDFQQHTRLGGRLAAPSTSMSDGIQDSDRTEAESTLQFESETTGILLVRVYEVLPTEAHLGLTLQSAETTVRNAEVPHGAPHDRIAKDLGREVSVSLSPTGEVLALRLEPGLSPDAENFWRDLLARWQLVRSGEPDDTEWSHYEIDPTGRCLVSYHLDADDRRTQGIGSEVAERVTKTRVEYVETHGSSGTAVTTRTDSWEEIEFLVQRVPTTIAGEGRVEIQLGMTVESIHSTITWSMSLAEALRDENLIALAADRRLHCASLVSSSLSDVRVPDKGKVRQALGQDDLAALIAELEGIVARDGVRNPEAVSIMTRLAASIRSSDLAVRMIREILDRGHLPEGMNSALFAALSAGGTSAAQELLRDVIGSDTRSERERRSALMSFAQVTHPDLEIDADLRALVSAAGPLANSALLVLGAVGDKTRSSDPARFAETRQYLLDRIAEPHARPAAQATAVRALANLGLPSTEPVLLDLYSRGDARLRRATLECFERTRDETATRFLTQAAQQEPDERLRTLSLQLLAIDGRPGQVDALVEIVMGSATEAVRYGALHYLSGHVTRDPEVRRLVTWIADSEPSDSMRRLARELLAQG